MTMKLMEAGQFQDRGQVYVFLKDNVIGQISGALISMIPSGMYLLTSVSLTTAILSLTRKNVLVQNMYSIETLARVDTLCLDKTGTLTDGKMIVYGYDLISDRFKDAKFEAIMSSFNYGAGDDNYTAQALKEKFGIKPIFETNEARPFNSVFKYSAVELADIGIICIGALGFVPLKDDSIIRKKVNEYSKKGYRVLVIGYSKRKLDDEKSLSNLEPIAPF